MKVYINSNGCAVLKHETERIARFFHINQWERTVDVEDADIVVMTCCGVTHNEENQAIAMISELNYKRKDGSLFIIGGCLPSFAKERIMDTAPDATLLTYQQIDELDTIVKPETPIKDVYYNIHPTIGKDSSDLRPDEDEKVMLAIDRYSGTDCCKVQYDFCTLRKYIWQDKDSYQIKVSYGCPGNCSYCATKLAIGQFRSVAKELVIKQFKEGIAAGYKKFMMVGDEVGCYGTDFGENILILLKDIYAINPDISIAIRYIHPDIFVHYYQGLKPYFASGFINYFCCAIQSASPSVLKAMNRNPDIEPFVKCLEDMNANGFKVNKHTQILVGFPNETDADVLATLNCLIRCDFDHININKYSPRKGTKSYEMDDNIPEDIKVRRCSMFRTLMEQNKRAKLYSAVKESILKNQI